LTQKAAIRRLRDMRVGIEHILSPYKGKRLMVRTPYDRSVSPETSDTYILARTQGWAVNTHMRERER
jgi:hypothetical protein